MKIVINIYLGFLQSIAIAIRKSFFLFSSQCSFLLRNMTLATFSIFALISLNTAAQKQSADSLVRVANSSENIQKVKIFNDVSRSYWYSSVDSSRKYATIALEIAKSNNFIVEHAKALNNLGVISDIEGDYSQSLNYYFSIINLAIEWGIFVPEIPNSFFLSIDKFTEEDPLGKPEEPKIAYDQKSPLSADDHEMLLRVLSNTYVNIGIVYGRLSQYEKSMVGLRQSLKIRESIKDERGMGVVLFNLGTVYLKLARYDLAMSAYQKSIAIRQEFNDPQGIANGFLAMGELYHAMNQLDSAYFYLSKANIAYEQLNNRRGLAQTYSYIGEVFGKLNRPYDAIDHLRKALVINGEINSREGIAITNLKLGTVYSNLNEYANAHNSFQTAFLIAKELGSGDLIADALIGKAKVYEKQGFIAKAYSTLKEYHQVFDSIRNEKFNVSIAQYQTLFQVDVKEKENALLKKDNDIKILELKRQKTFQSLLVIIVLVILFSGFSLLIMYRTILSANRKLQALNSELENKVNERTKDLREALKIAEDAYNLKNSFLANISHEIRTPLNGIMGFSSLISNEIDGNQDVQRYVHEIRSSGNRLMYLLNNLIDISRAESNSFRMRMISTSINETIEEAIQSPDENVFNPEVIVNKNLGTIPEISADRDLLIRVFSIVIGNALKYTQKGTINITSHYNSNDNCIEVSVSDTGVGIDADYLPLIFEPFRQESTGLTRSFQGAGLGLPLAKRIVQLMSGELEITSRKGVGTMVNITFPLSSDNKLLKPTPTVDTKLPVSPFKAKARKAKVLIVEENSYTRFYLQALLKKYVQVAVARDGSEALSLLADSLTFGSMFDLIIIDINLPEPWNPSLLLNEIQNRKHEYSKRPFVLQAQADNFNEADVKLYASQGFKQIVNKPLDKEKILELLRKYSSLQKVQ
jgi:signal transduction histidine kinase/CheY-like chemotaxis protein